MIRHIDSEDPSSKLICHALLSVQEQIAVLREDMGGVKTRLSRLHSSFATLQSSVAAFHVDLVDLAKCPHVWTGLRTALSA